jgi:hypothetical protein
MPVSYEVVVEVGGDTVHGVETERSTRPRGETIGRLHTRS